MSGYTLLSTPHTHVTETPDVWTQRAPTSMRDRVPRIETNSKGTQRWVLGDDKGILANPGMTATAGRGSFKNPQELRRDTSGCIRSYSAAQVHGPDGDLGHGDVSERWRLRRSAFLEAQ